MQWANGSLSYSIEGDKADEPTHTRVHTRDNSSTLALSGKVLRSGGRSRRDPEFLIKSRQIEYELASYLIRRSEAELFCAWLPHRWRH